MCGNMLDHQIIEQASKRHPADVRHPRFGPDPTEAVTGPPGVRHEANMEYYRAQPNTSEPRRSSWMNTAAIAAKRRVHTRTFERTQNTQQIKKKNCPFRKPFHHLGATTSPTTSVSQSRFVYLNLTQTQTQARIRRLTLTLNPNPST